MKLVLSIMEETDKFILKETSCFTDLCFCHNPSPIIFALYMLGTAILLKITLFAKKVKMKRVKLIKFEFYCHSRHWQGLDLK